jgi:hypothetical protein
MEQFNKVERIKKLIEMMKSNAYRFYEYLEGINNNGGRYSKYRTA